VRAIPLHRSPKRPRRRCPVCSRPVGTDRQGHLVGHGPHESCAGSYMQARP
jgi:hypothetical protein